MANGHGDRYGDERIQRLEQATERLSSNVIGLSTALALVTEISERQAEVETRQSDIENKAHDAKVVAEDLSKKYLTVERARTRTHVFYSMWLLLLLFFISYTRYQSIQQIHDRLVASHAGCVKSNQRVDTEIDFLNSLISPKSSPEGVAKVRGYIQKLEEQKGDCSTFDPKTNTPGFFALT
jgi:cell division protein ZapA (FtsZ GTPase activity inhibitor)